MLSFLYYFIWIYCSIHIERHPLIFWVAFVLFGWWVFSPPATIQDAANNNLTGVHNSCKCLLFVPVYRRCWTDVIYDFGREMFVRRLFGYCVECKWAHLLRYESQSIHWATLCFGHPVYLPVVTITVSLLTEKRIREECTVHSSGVFLLNLSASLISDGRGICWDECWQPWICFPFWRTQGR